MELFASSGELSRLEAALAEAQGAARIDALAELAWHLRQRDSTRALSLIEAMPAPLTAALRVRTALTKCEVSALFCRFDAAEESLADARSALLRSSDPIADGDAWLAEAVLAKARGQRDRELAAHEHSVAAFRAAGEPRRLAIAQAWAAYERAFTEPDAEPIFDAPPLETDTEAHPAWDALASAARALVLSRREPAQAANVFLHASEQAQAVGMLRHAVVCAMNAGTALQGLGDFDSAAGCFAFAAGQARQSGWPALLGSSQTKLGTFLKELGRLDESRVVLGEALQSLAVTPAGINKANACSALAETLLAMGLAVESVEPMAEAIRLYREARSTDNLALNLIGQARALSAAGQPQRALAAIAEAEALIVRHGFSALGVGVSEALAEIHQRHPLPPPPGMTAPNAGIHYAEAILREGLLINGWKPPATLFVALADAWAAAGDLARAYDYARKALAVKEQEVASKLIHPLAVLRLRGEGTTGLAGVAAVLRAPAAAPATPGEAPLSARILTPKERQILELLARNYSNKEIATTLEVSDETVKWHLKNMYTKLEAGSRKHAVTRARTLGVISFSS